MNIVIINRKSRCVMVTRTRVSFFFFFWKKHEILSLDFFLYIYLSKIVYFDRNWVLFIVLKLTDRICLFGLIELLLSTYTFTNCTIKKHIFFLSFFNGKKTTVGNSSKIEYYIIRLVKFTF